ncbi:MAG TPA: glycoside-pentoside-hexuronide (GPH):cation symporter [Clostridia bacterium]|nr:glycoside-pentoside-hexuronide (GPH):cation symporter [Clostridia bacterium]
MSNNSGGIKKVPLYEKLGYGVGSIGKDMCYALVGSFFLYYCTDNLGISASFMGTLFFFARLWDAFNDPLMGTIVDNTRNKFGKYRTWLAIGSVVNAFVLIMLFSAPDFLAGNPGLTKVYASTLYVLWGMSYTLVDVPYWSFVCVMTTDQRERDVVSTIPRVFAGAGNLLTQVLTLKMITLIGKGDLQAGFQRWAIIIAVLFIGFMTITVSTIKERTIVKQDKKFSLKDAIRTLKNNDQLMTIVLILILTNLAMNMTTGVAIYYFKYVWKDPLIYSSFAIVVGAAVAIGLVSYPFIAKKIARRKIFIASMIMPSIGFVLMFVISKLVGIGAAEGPNIDITKALIAFAVPALVFCTGFGSIGVMTTVILADTVDYGEWKLGYRSESIVFSMQTFMVKFATAIAGLVTGWGLSIAGYVSVNADKTSTIGMDGRSAQAILDAAIAAQTNLSGVQNALNIMMFAIPPVILITALIIYLKRYKLNGEFLNKVNEELVVIRAKKNEEYDLLHKKTSDEISE